MESRRLEIKIRRGAVGVGNDCESRKLQLAGGTNLLKSRSEGTERQEGVSQRIIHWRYSSLGVVNSLGGSDNESGTKIFKE